MRKTLVAAVVVLVAVLFCGSSFAQEIKIAVVDINKVLNLSESGKAARKKMEARYEELKKDIDARQEDAKKLKDEIDRQKVMLGKDKLKEKEDALAAKVADLRRLTQEAEADMREREGELTREVLQQIEAQLEIIVKAEKYDLILERSAGVVHVTDSMDITNRVLELLNKNPKTPATNKEAGGGK